MGSDDMNDTDATRSVSPGFEMLTYALVTPSPPAAPGQNHEELMRRVSDTCGNALSSPFATAAPSGAPDACLSTVTMATMLARTSRKPDARRTRFILHHPRK